MITMTTRTIRIFFLALTATGCGNSPSGIDAGPVSIDATPVHIDASPGGQDATAADAQAGVDAGSPDAVGFALWHSWDGTYSLTFAEISNTCSSPNLTGLLYLTITGVEDPPAIPSMDGTAWYRRDADPSCCFWPAARVTSPGHVQIDGFSIVSECLAVQTSATTFSCQLTRHVAAVPPDGPCDTIWTMTASLP